LIKDPVKGDNIDTSSSANPKIAILNVAYPDFAHFVASHKVDIQAFIEVETFIRGALRPSSLLAECFPINKFVMMLAEDLPKLKNLLT